MNSFSFYQDNNNQTWLPQTSFESIFQSQDNIESSFFNDNISMFFMPESQQMSFFESQETPKESSPVKAKQSSKKETSKCMVSSFANLVGQCSSFWTSKMNQHASRNEPLNTEGCKQESEVTYEETAKSKKRAANQDNLNKVSQKQIKKQPKKQNEKWQRKYDSRLLSLVKELGQDWTEVAGAFEESFITPKYLEGRYKVLSNKKSIKEEDLAATRSSSLKEEDNGSWTDLLSTEQPNYTGNHFYLMRDDIELGYAKQNCQGFIGFEQLQPTREASSQGCESTPERTQEDIIDSYFNTDSFQELDHTLLENNHLFQKMDFSEGLEETNQRNNQFSTPVKVEEDDMGRNLLDEKPKEEVIEILNGRISLIQSLYNQTWMELMKLQRERRSELNLA